MKPNLSGLTALGVRRPILITVVNLLILLVGLVSFLGVDVRELPDVDTPIVTVRSIYEGASPYTMDAEVTAKLEGAVARISGVRSIASSSEENNMRMRVEFSPDVDLNLAASDVREAVSRVQRDLPDNIDQITVIKADADARAIMQVIASSPSLSSQALTERVERDIIPSLLSVDGVADIQLEGQEPRTLRIQIDPARLAAFKLAIGDVLAPLRSISADIPAGAYVSSDQELLIRANASTLTPDQVLSLQIRDKLYIRDVAEVLFAPQTPESYSLLNGRPVISMGVVRRAGANTIEIADAIAGRVARMNEQYKGEVALTINTNDAIFIKGALSEVTFSLLIAVAVVLLVIALFLGQLKPVLVPAVTMPVALIGTLAAIWLAGFSVNLLTLLALVLATGLIVDDAIVVLENIQRRVNQGLPRYAAALLGTRQVFFAVIATTVTLVSVFLPIAFLPGDTGRLFQEFGLVLSMAVIISTFVALTLCPMIASRVLVPTDDSKPHSGTVALLERMGHSFSQLYLSSLEFLLHHRYIALLLACGIAVAGGIGYKSLNQELLPEEDRGRLQILITGPDGASLEYTGRQAQAVEAVLNPYLEKGLVTDLFTIVGRWDKNRGYTSANLVGWDERSVSQGEIARELNKALKDLPGGQVRILPDSSLNIRGGGAGLKVAILGNDYDSMALVADDFAQQIEANVPNIDSVRVEYDTSQPQLSFEINRPLAAELGVPIEQISQMLRVMVDELELLDLSIGDRAVPVVVASSKGRINDPNDLLNLFLLSNNGSLVPLSSLVTVQERGVAAELDRHAQRRAIELTLSVPPGTALDRTLTSIQSLANEKLPAGYDLILLGEAAQLVDASDEMMITFAVALLVVFLVLAAQFESVGSAFIVMFTVPFGLAAAVFALLASGQSLNLYSQIGLVMLIGLMTKNAILLVEMMDQFRDLGRTVEEAIYEGVKLRLRPVMMTALSTVLGGLPLIITSGPGAEARQAIGWVIVGGLGISTLLTLYLAPMAYRLIAPWVPPRAAAGKRLEDELDRTVDNEEGKEALI